MAVITAKFPGSVTAAPGCAPLRTKLTALPVVVQVNVKGLPAVISEYPTLVSWTFADARAKAADAMKRVENCILMVL